MTHVFISYKRDDVDFVLQLEQRLKQADVDVWTDAQIQAGSNWRSKIDDAIQDAFAVIVVMTPEARVSEYVTYEWAFAMGLGKAIIPLIIKDTEVHPKLFDVQHIDFTDAPRRDWDRLISTMKALDPQSHSQQDVPRSVRQAVDNLDNLDKNTRQQALAALEMMAPHPAAMQALGQALTHVMLDVRQMTASALNRIFLAHDQPYFTDLVPDLIHAMNDYDPKVQNITVSNMGLVGGDEALAYLWEQIKQTYGDNQESWRLNPGKDVRLRVTRRIIINGKYSEASHNLIQEIESLADSESDNLFNRITYYLFLDDESAENYAFS